MKRAGIVLFWATFILPSVLYLVINFYWWLFDGNVLNADKMFGAFMALIIMIMPGMYLVVEEWN